MNSWNSETSIIIFFSAKQGFCNWNQFMLCHWIDKLMTFRKIQVIFFLSTHQWNKVVHWNQLQSNTNLKTLDAFFVKLTRNCPFTTYHPCTHKWKHKHRQWRPRALQKSTQNLTTNKNASKWTKRMIWYHCRLKSSKTKGVTKAVPFPGGWKEKGGGGLGISRAKTMAKGRWKWGVSYNGVKVEIDRGGGLWPWELSSLSGALLLSAFCFAFASPIHPRSGCVSFLFSLFGQWTVPATRLALLLFLVYLFYFHYLGLGLH